MSDGSLVIDTELDNDGFEKGSDKLLSAIDGLSKRIDALGSNMQKSFTGITEILRNIAMASQQSASSVQSQTQAAAQAATQTTQAQAATATATEKATQATSAYDKELARLQKQIDGTKAKLADYYAAVEEIHNTTNETLAQTEDPEQVERVLEIEQIQLDAVNQKYATKIATLEQLEAEYARVAAASQEAAQGDASAGAVQQVAQAEQEAAQSSQQLTGALQGVDQELRQKPADAGAAGGAFSGLRSAMNAVGNAAIGVGRNITKMGFNALANGIKKATSRLKSFQSQSAKTTLTSNALVKSLTSFKRLLITRVKRMFISAIFNQAKEAVSKLAEYSGAVKSSMDNIKNSAKMLSGNLSVTIGNILTTLEPIITRIINLISQAVQWVNQFFSLLSGKRTYTRAKQGAQGAADATGAAAENQKKWNNELYSFDELNKQSDQSDNSSGGGGGGGAEITEPEYEEVEIDLPEGVQDWIERLKEAWTSGDWYGVGTVIAEGLNAAMGVVDNWINDTLRPLGVTWAGRFAEILNGLTDGLDWELLGKTVADGLNAIADIYNTFMYSYDWENLGTKIGEALNSFVDNIEWDSIGQAFAAKLQALVQAVHGFVHSVDWAALGDGIGTAVYSWFSSIDWVKAADFIVTGFNGLVTTLRSAIAAIDWSQVGITIAESFTTLIMNIDWGNLGALLCDAVLALLDMALAALSNIDWFAVGDSIGKGIADMIANIDWLQVLAVLGSCIISLVNGAVQIVLGLLSGLAERLAEAFRSIGWDGIAGLFQGISEGLANVGAWIKEHIVDPIVNGVKEFFGIASPSTVMAEIGQYIVLGLLQGLQEAWLFIVEFFTNVLTALQEQLQLAWDTIVMAAQLAWQNLTTSITTFFTSAKESIFLTAQTVQEKMTETWTNIKNTVASNLRTILSETKARFTEMRSTIEQLMSAAKSTLISHVQNMRTSAVSAWNGLLASCKSIFNGVYSTIVSLISRATSYIAGTSWVSLGVNLMQGFLNGLRSMMSTIWSEVQAFVQRCVNAIKSVLHIGSPSKVLEEIGEFTGMGFINGIKNEEDDAVKTVRNLATAVSDEMTDGVGDVAATMPGIDAVVDKLKDLADVFRTIADMLASTGGLTVPQIAAGTVAPYKTRAAANAAPTDASEPFTGRMDEILSVLQALLDAIRSRGQTSAPIKIIMDGREVFNVVVEENNREITRTGASPIRV